jgi:hypothetical protein
MKNETPNITMAHVTSDIRQLAFEVNNIAITVSALVEVLGVDKDKLKKTAQAVFEAALAESNKNDESNKDALSPENISASGPATHPENAVIFGDD